MSESVIFAMTDELWVMRCLDPDILKDERQKNFEIWEFSVWLHVMRFFSYQGYDYKWITFFYSSFVCESQSRIYIYFFYWTKETWNSEFLCRTPSIFYTNNYLIKFNYLIIQLKKNNYSGRQFQLKNSNHLIMNFFIWKNKIKNSDKHKIQKKSSFK